MENSDPIRDQAPRNYWALCRDQTGIVVLLVAVLMPVFVGFAALAVDIGHLTVVKAELQNAADAEALARAGKLYPNPPAGFASPDWDGAEKANSLANTADGNRIIFDVETGYWDPANPAAGLQDPGEVPPCRIVGQPAVRVTVSQPVGHRFAAYFGIDSSDASAVATAVILPPGAVPQNVVLPVAITEEVANRANEFYDSSHILTITSAYSNSATMAEQWTSFKDQDNSAATLKQLLSSKNPTSLDKGDKIWVQRGTKASLYDHLANYVNHDVMLPVVKVPANTPLKESTGTWREIIALAGFRITAVNKHGNQSYFTGYFISGLNVGPTGTTGTNYYGVGTPPRLVQ